MDVENKLFYKYIFVVLTYRNTEDIKDLFESFKLINKGEHKAIIVNSYYDDETRSALETFAENNGADFINVPNKGYSFGNNRGIESALNNYSFDWLIVANPDTVIKKFDFTVFDNVSGCVIAPEILNLANKKQNPMGKKNSRLKDFLVYKGCLHNNAFLMYLGIAFGKLKNKFVVCRKCKNDKRLKKINMAHGSFVIFSKGVFEKIGLPYDENMFLFAEEGVLSKKLSGVADTYYTNCISVLHKEDGSMKYEKNKIAENLRNANIYYYENYAKKK